MALTRREFLFAGFAAGAVAAVGVVIPVSRLAGGQAGDAPAAVVGFFRRLRVASVSDLASRDPVFFDYPLRGQANLIAKLGVPVSGGIGPDEDIVAFSRICTHMGCELTDYRPDQHVLGPCPCHFTTFDLAHDGQVVLGQATQNLPRVMLEIEGDDVYATGLIRLVYGFQNTLAGAEMVEA